MTFGKFYTKSNKYYAKFFSSKINPVNRMITFGNQIMLTRMILLRSFLINKSLSCSSHFISVNQFETTITKNENSMSIVLQALLKLGLCSNIVNYLKCISISPQWNGLSNHVVSDEMKSAVRNIPNN